MKVYPILHSALGPRPKESTIQGVYGNLDDAKAFLRGVLEVFGTGASFEMAEDGRSLSYLVEDSLIIWKIDEHDLRGPVR